MGIDLVHADGYARGMKAESLWALTVVSMLGAAAVLPSVEPLESQATQVVDRVPSCDNTACMAGWTAAAAAELTDAAECPRVAASQAEIAGCKAFVQWAHDEGALQAMVESGH